MLLALATLRDASSVLFPGGFRNSFIFLLVLMAAPASVAVALSNDRLASKAEGSKGGTWEMGGEDEDAEQEKYISEKKTPMRRSVPLSVRERCTLKKLAGCGTFSHCHAPE